VIDYGGMGLETTQLPDAPDQFFRGLEASADEDPTAGMGTFAKMATAPLRIAPYALGALTARAGGAAAGAVAGGPAGAAAGQYAAGAAFDILQNAGPLYRRLRRLAGPDGAPLLTDDQAKSMAWGFAVPIGAATALLGGAAPTVKDAVARTTGQAISQALEQVTVRQLAGRAAMHLAKDVGVGIAAMATQAAGNALALEQGKFVGGGQPDWAQVPAAAVEAGKSALIDLSALALFGAGHRFFSDHAMLVRTQQSKALATALTDTAAASEAVQKFPAVVQELIAKAKRENGAVQHAHYDLEGWDAYWQGKNLDPGAVAAQVVGDGGAAYQEARATGELRLPIEGWVAKIAGSEHADGLSQDLKLYQDALTPRQEKEFTKAQQKLATAAEQAEPEAAKTLFRDFYGQARQALNSTKVPQKRRDAVAKANAELYASVVKTIAAREGWTIEDARARLGLLTIQHGTGEAVAPAPVAPRPAAAPAVVAAPESAPAPVAPVVAVGKAAGSVITPQKPNGEKVRYQVVEARDLVPSHNPDTFGANLSYPAGVQERDYAGQPAEQMKVVSGGARLNPAILLTDTPSPLDGPPIVTSGRPLVLGGNGRTMMIQRAFRDPALRDQYKAALSEKAQAFGLTAEDVAKFDSPVLVRVANVAHDAPQQELVGAVRRFNEGMTQQLSPRARAIAEARTLSPETVESLGELLSTLETGSLRDLLRDRPRDVVDVLRRDGVINPQNQGQWLHRGELTPEAKDRVEGMFLGRVLGSEDRYAASSPELLGKVERLAPFLIRVEGINPGLDETPTVRAALDLVNQAKASGSTLDDYLNQGALFQTSRDPAAVKMAQLLADSTAKQLAARFKAWSQFAAVDPRQATMFAPGATKEGARTLLFGKESKLLQAAYHGSPHVFEQFSLQHIGAGEGAQAYGHGLYFAENPEVAKYYRDALSDVALTMRGLRGKDLTPDTPENEAYHALVRAAQSVHGFAGQGTEEVIRRAVGTVDQLARKYRLDVAVLEGLLEVPEKDRYDDAKGTGFETMRLDDARLRSEIAFYKAMLEPHEKAVELLKSLRPDEIGIDRGALYKVDVPEADRLLDYDKDIAQQPVAIRAAVAKLMPKPEIVQIGERLSDIRVSGSSIGSFQHERAQALVESGEWVNHVPWNGGTFYQVLTRQLGSAEKVSEALRAAGIPGLRYFDKFSRASGDGSHNFVIWDEKEIPVLDRLFQPVGNIDGQPLGYDTARGFISIGGTSDAPKFSIHLLENADESTLAHETAHFFGEALGHLAQRLDASDALKKDYATLLKAMGYGSHEERQRASVSRRALEGSLVRNAEEDGLLSDLRSREESLAVMWEQYLAEGKAPSEGLKGVFSRFARWMKAIYKSLGNISGQFEQTYGKELVLSDDVRQVFSRLLATDEEMAAYKAPADAPQKPSFEDILAKVPDASEEKAQFKARAQAINRTAIREIAEQTIAARKVADLDPRYFLFAARRAKDKSLQEGLKPEEAFAAREQQYLSEALYRAARDAKAEGQKLRARLQRFTSDDVRAKIGKATTEVEAADGTKTVTQPYLDRVDELLGHFELGTGISRGTVAERLVTADWIGREQAAGRDVVVPPSVLRNLDRQVHWSELTLDELRDLHNAVKSIAQQAELKRTILEKGKRRDKGEAIGELVAAAFANRKEVPFFAQETAPQGMVAVAQAVQRGVYALIRPENLIRELDGGKLDGPWARMIFNPLKDSTNEWYGLLRESVKSIRDALDALPAEDLTRLRSTRFKVNGQEFTMEAALAVALNWGNDSNRQKLVKGWQHPTVKLRGLTQWNADTPGEFLSRLTKRDWEITQLIWDRLESIWPRAADLEKRLTGLAPDKVEPKAFSINTADGQVAELRGGYYPVMYDPRFEGAGARTQEALDLRNIALFDRNYQRAATPQGHLETRVEGYARPVRLAVFSQLPRRLSEHAKDVAMRESLLSVHSLLTDDQVRAALQRSVGVAGEKVLQGWLRDTANELVAPDNGSGAWSDWMARGRRGYIASVFAYNIPQTLQNLTGMLPATHAVGAQWMARSLSEFAQDRKAMVALVDSKSAEMREREFSSHAEIGRALRELTVKRSFDERLSEAGLAFWEATDKAVAYPTWLANYRKALATVEEGGLGYSDELAVQHANREVRTKVMAGSTVDLPAIMRNRFLRWAIPFYGWLNNRFNLLYSAVGDAKRADTAWAATKVMGGTIAVLVAEQVLSELATGKGPNDENDDGTINAADWGRWMARKVLLTPTGWVPVVGRVIQSAESGHDVSLTPEVGTLVAAQKTLQGAHKIAFGDEPSDADDLLGEAQNIVETVGYVRGWPVVQLRKTAKYLRAVNSGEEPIKNPADAAMGGVFGPRRPGTLRHAIEE
jgi:hypothetical protein